MAIALTTKVTALGRVGQVVAKRLKNLGIETVRDLIFYFPTRYEDFSHCSKISDLTPDMSTTVHGQIELIETKRSKIKRMTITEALIGDGTGMVRAVWFNQPFLEDSLVVGEKVYISGHVDFNNFGISFNSPNFEKESNWNKNGNFNTGRILPVYPLTANLTNKQLRFLMQQVIGAVHEVVEWLPADIVTKSKLLDIQAALREIHFPTTLEALDLARRRLKFDELFLIQLVSRSLRQDIDNSQAPVINFQEEETKKFVKALPFSLTASQKKTGWEILQDLAKSRPMNRLLEGDVGSGKTVVAALAILNVALNNQQSVIMAPTEVLANQHFETFKKIFGGQAGFRISILTSSRQMYYCEGQEEKLSKKKIVDKIKVGELDLVVGTQALIQEDVLFQDLALVIVDEQHRFGVNQRQILREKSGLNLVPHFLSMTATPIPRSLALTLYGDLDLSIIRELPPDRKQIMTRFIGPENRNKAYQFIREQIKVGRQVFVICPLIDVSDKLGVKAATAEYERLNKEVFPELTIGLLHGRMKSKEKEEVMQNFLNGEVQILVSTSVVEVGIDVPNATVMMIEGADRFGLAQLHQFRGRVGRAEHQSYCILFSDSGAGKSNQRLQFFASCLDGFKLAEEDLKSRGPGQFFGVKQSGLPDLKLASFNDLDLIAETRQWAEWVFSSENGLEKFSILREVVEGYRAQVRLE